MLFPVAERLGFEYKADHFGHVQEGEIRDMVGISQETSTTTRQQEKKLAKRRKHKHYE